MTVDIRPLNKKLKADYSYLFDNMIHKENPEWSKCYCNDYHFLGDVDICTHAMSRSMIIKRIEDDELQGYLAFKDGKTIGWCNDANNHQPSTINHQPSTNNQQPSTINHQPSTNFTNTGSR
jgi:hypothetical protein